MEQAKKPTIGFRIMQVVGCLFALMLVAAILFPIFAKARESTWRHSNCQSDLKQLGYSLACYEQDYDGKFPCAEGGPNNSDTGWAGELYTYIKATGLFHCPQDATVASGNLVPISYAANWNLQESSGKLGGVNVLTLPSPNLTVAMCEVQGIVSDPTVLDPANDKSPFVNMSPAYWGGGLPHGYGKYATGSAPGEPIQQAGPVPRHDPGAMYLLADGHVKYLRPEKISPGYTAVSKSSVENATGTSNNASGTGCLDNLPADWGKPGCPHPGTATVTFSPR